MAMLDKANTDSYGNPEITKVNIGVRKNPGILVSGHDLRDLEMLLEQTQGRKIFLFANFSRNMCTSRISRSAGSVKSVFVTILRRNNAVGCH